MPIRLIQYQTQGGVAVGCIEDDGTAFALTGVSSVYDLAQRAIAQNTSLADAVAQTAHGEAIDPRALAAENRLLCPITHADPAHLLMTGTGLTHLGSAEGRDKMHKAAQDTEKQTDSIRMFQMGVEGGKPAAGAVGVQPEWFYKGDGTMAVRPGGDLVAPQFAQDGGEEPELAGIYMVGPDGTPYRIGFALANEFSDHVVEKQNYLWLAHSKLRQAAFGPELFVGELPQSVEGTSSIVRGGETVWSKPFVTGEANMSHTLANLEHHHFKYDIFRRPGDIHVHFFGTATLSFSDNVQTQDGDKFVIEAAPFTLPLTNFLRMTAGEETPVAVKTL